jgi:hypothetical protein
MEAVEFFQYIKVPMTVAHVIAVVFGMGSALVSDALFSFFGRDKNLNNTELSTLSLLSKLVLYSLPLIILSGMALFLTNIDKYLNSNKFLAKMTILCILLLNGFVLNKYVWPHLLSNKFFTSKKERGIRKLAFACGAISVISWLSVCTLGILDNLSMSYNLILAMYLVVIVFGSLVSIVIEKKELN